MEEIQGGHCPCSKIQGGQPTTLPPPCRAPPARGKPTVVSVYADLDTDKTRLGPSAKRESDPDPKLTLEL